MSINDEKLRKCDKFIPQNITQSLKTEIMEFTDNEMEL